MVNGSYSLLEQLNVKLYTTQGYADDPVTVVLGKQLNTVAELMQRGLRLSVNSEKIGVILLTRIRKTKEVIRLEYQGVKLTLTKEVKYLGVVLDEK